MEIKEIEVLKLELKPGETLIVKIKSDEVSPGDLRELHKGFKAKFPNNEVAMVCLGSQDDMELTVVKDSSSIETKSCENVNSYCADCSCGKKERLGGS